MALSDEQGQVVAEWVRDPFGNVVSKTGTVEDNHLFPGQFWDADANLAYNWNRWYAPELGRYIEVDPVSISRWQPDPYSYAKSDPLINQDPSGLFSLHGFPPSLSDTLIDSVSEGMRRLEQCASCGCDDFNDEEKEDFRKAITALNNAEIYYQPIIPSESGGRAFGKGDIDGRRIWISDVGIAQSGKCNLAKTLAHEALHNVGHDEPVVRSMISRCMGCY